MPWSDDTRCLYCDGKLPLYRKLTQGQFCSKQHQAAYWGEQERLAVERLHQTHDALMAYRPPGPIESILGPAVAAPGFEEPGDPLEALLQAAEAPAALQDQAGESVARAGLVAQPLGPARGASPELVAADPLEYEMTSRPQLPRHGPKAVGALHVWRPVAFDTWAAAAPHPSAIRFVLESAMYPDTAIPTTILPRHTRKSGPSLEAAGGVAISAAVSSRPEGSSQLCEKDEALEPSADPVSQVRLSARPLGGLPDGIELDHIRPSEHLSRLPFITAADQARQARGAGFDSLTFTVVPWMPRMEAGPPAWNDTWAPTVPGLRRLAATPAWSTPRACATDVQPIHPPLPHAKRLTRAAEPPAFAPCEAGMGALAMAVQGQVAAPLRQPTKELVPPTPDLEYPEVVPPTGDFGIRTQSAEIQSLPYRKRMRASAGTVKPRTLPGSMVITLQGEPILPHLRLEPLLGKYLADLFRRGGRPATEIPWIRPATVMSPVLDFWYNAPRDLKLLLFAIPLLIALVFHPSLPKVAVSAPVDDTGLPSEFKQAVSAQFANLRQSVLNRAAVALDEDFRQGLDNWTSRGGATTEWAFDATGFVQPGPLAFYKPSMDLTDYQMQFLGMIDQQALSWVVRAADFQNYYVIKLVVLRPGPLPLIGLTRYAVIDGIPQDRVDRPVPITARENMQYRVRLEVHGNDFSLEVLGHMVDSWSEPRLDHGGVGFFTNRGEESRVRWVQVTHQYDVLGRLCAYLAPYNIPTTTGSW